MCNDSYSLSQAAFHTLMIPMEPNVLSISSTVASGGRPEIKIVSSWYSLGSPKIISISSNYE
jgi:hypothetical protein